MNRFYVSIIVAIMLVSVELLLKKFAQVSLKPILPLSGNVSITAFRF